MPGIDWYWHRLRSMDVAEVGMHWRKKVVQASERISPPKLFVPQTVSAFPVLPFPNAASESLLNSLKKSAEAIMRREWKFFGDRVLKVDDPPEWQHDYLAGVSLPTHSSAFRLNHRELPSGADVKVVWELSRWHEITRLAQAGWILKEQAFSEKALAWLEDWILKNPPYKGWNWISALESGLRLVQFAWIDALIEAGPEFRERAPRLDTLRKNLLSPHARFTWRYRSFGTSANNHLLGELAGLIVASVRWPGLVGSCPDLPALRSLWQKEVLAQFAEDGGNREQALNYHLFSWELCLHSRLALAAAKMEVDSAVDDRLEQSARFFVNVQTDNEPWDYGDSDNALVIPLGDREEENSIEWKRWMEGAQTSSIAFWIGKRKAPFRPADGWQHFAASGYLTFKSADWFLRWDVSPLGYLRTGAHGHLDALHLSIWYQGVAIIVDPGTGAYYPDPELRNYLASRNAHNGPSPLSEQIGCRRGPFLWSKPHSKPVVSQEGLGLTAELVIPKGKLVRTLRPVTGQPGWTITDHFAAEHAENGFTVLWQFPPGITLQQTGPREFALKHPAVKIALQFGATWSGVELGRPAGQPRTGEGTVSRFFRQKEFGDFIKLTAPRHDSGAFESRFLACGGG